MCAVVRLRVALETVQAKYGTEMMKVCEYILTAYRNAERHMLSDYVYTVCACALCEARICDERALMLLRAGRLDAAAVGRSPRLAQISSGRIG